MIVVDASVAVKWSVDEAGHEEALRVLDVGGRLSAPDLIVAEVANVLRKKERGGQVSGEQINLAMVAIAEALEFVSCSILWGDALELSRALNHSVYDCFYLALAASGGLFVTADEKFIRKVQQSGLGHLVTTPAEIGTSSLSSGRSPIERSVLSDVIRLAARVEATFKGLYDTPTEETGGFRFRSVTIYSPAFSSPAYVRLKQILRGLTRQELAMLLALGWLGRAYHSRDEWEQLVSHADLLASEGFDKEGRYMIAQMPLVSAGLFKLQNPI